MNWMKSNRYKFIRFIIQIWTSSRSFKFISYSDHFLEFSGYVLLERAVGKNEKLESLKLESFAEVGKSQAKLERIEQFKLSNFISHFPTSARAFQLQLELSNFAGFFPTSLGSFQLRWVLSNFSATFQLQTFQLKTFQLLVLSNCPFQLHVSLEIRSERYNRRYFFSRSSFSKWLHVQCIRLYSKP